MITKRNLDEVSFIRPILIVLLIFVHCFTVFNGGWPPFPGYQDSVCYMWFSRTCYSFMLETFIFISGYVWAYQVLNLQKSTSLSILIKKKAERLLLPSVVFSIIYAQIFDNVCVNDLIGGGKIVLSIISGIGHLWYLPVLFWCFVALWILERLDISDLFKFLLLLLVAILPFPYIPFQLSRVPYYLFFFFVGYKFWQHGESFRENLNGKKVVVFSFLFSIIFVVLRTLSAYLLELADETSIIQKVVLIMASNSSKIIYSSFGVIAIYTLAVWFTKTYKLCSWYIQVGGLCFGVYVFQEFIIKYIYYYTEFPLSIGYKALPWLTFIITLVMSLLLSKTTKSL